jgi:hypothetical protein
LNPQAGERLRIPNINERIRSIKKMKKRIFATPAVAIAIPVNPKTAAIMETMKKTSTQ